MTAISFNSVAKFLHFEIIFKIVTSVLFGQ